MLSWLTAATNLDGTVYINSDMSSLQAPPGNTYTGVRAGGGATQIFRAARENLGKASF